jgi:hypothetical protein
MGHALVEINGNVSGSFAYYGSPYTLYEQFNYTGVASVR